MEMIIPVKPFESYAWRWLHLQPTEGLLRAPVYLGVLRALAKNEGRAYTSKSLHDDLYRVQIDTGTNVILAREPTRNLLRNSGQYWRGMGVLDGNRHEIELTPLGKSVANGEVTLNEFASKIIASAVLPNEYTYKRDMAQQWKNANLTIMPFALIIMTMEHLGKNFGIDAAYLTPNELSRIVIPLAGDKYVAGKISECVMLYRIGKLDITNWPNCTPQANDERLSREFLLFLKHFGICATRRMKLVWDEQYYFDGTFHKMYSVDVGEPTEDGEDTIDVTPSTNVNKFIELIERRKILTWAIERSGQATFRKKVLQAANYRCIFTGDCLPDALDACHIIPVEQGGKDDASNGFCMRVDLHRLFDNRHLRIKASGEVVRSSRLEQSIGYKDLPTIIKFPKAVSTQNVAWRENYM